MKEIEKKMVDAVDNGRNFTGNNTTVRHEDGNTYVYLFGNLIYKIVDGKAQFSMCGWNTTTTRSRLNALGVNVRSKEGQAYHNGKPIENIYEFINL